MREIRFRAWNVNEKYMVDSKVGVANIVKKHILEGNYKTGWYTQKTGEENYILMQYIGLKDKNGVEICEGDYIEIYQDIYETFSEGSFECNDFYVWEEPVDTLEEKGVVMFGKGAFAVDEWLLNWFEENELEVIGNIYENPQLLEVK